MIEKKKSKVLNPRIIALILNLVLYLIKVLLLTIDVVHLQVIILLVAINLLIVN